MTENSNKGVPKSAQHKANIGIGMKASWAKRKAAQFLVPIKLESNDVDQVALNSPNTMILLNKINKK